MTRYVAFLRAINVGGRRVTMDRLRAVFADDLGLDDVSTYIASGNVLFSTGRRADAALEAEIEAGLTAALGWEVPTIVRSAAELAAVVDADVFGDDVADGETYHVLFLKRRPTAAESSAIEALSGAVDTLVVRGRELHWHVRGKSMDSQLKPKAMEKAAGDNAATARNITMLRKLVPKLD